MNKSCPSHDASMSNNDVIVMSEWWYLHDVTFNSRHNQFMQWLLDVTAYPDIVKISHWWSRDYKVKRTFAECYLCTEASHHVSCPDTRCSRRNNTDWMGACTQRRRWAWLQANRHHTATGLQPGNIATYKIALNTYLCLQLIWIINKFIARLRK